MDFSDAVKQFEWGKINLSEKQFKELLAEQKDNPEIHFYLSKIFLQKDQYDQALEHIENAIKLDAQKAEYHEMLGEILGMKAQQAGMIKGAMLLRKVKSAFEQAINLNENSLMAKEGLFMIYLFSPPVAGGDEKKAMELLEQIKNHNKSHGHLAQAMVYLKQNKLSDAEREFEEAIKENGGDREVLKRTFRFYLQRKNYDKCDEIADLYINHFPQDPRGYQFKGEAYLEAGQPDEALSLFNLAIEKDELFFNGYFHRAKVFLAKNQKEMAANDIKFILDHQEAPQELKKQAKKLM